MILSVAMTTPPNNNNKKNKIKRLYWIHIYRFRNWIKRSHNKQRHVKKNLNCVCVCVCGREEVSGKELKKKENLMAC